MVSGAEHPDRVGQHFRFIDAAVAAGVEQAGDGRVAAVATADVAAAAVVVLADPVAHQGKTYELTGPQGLTLAEVAEVLSAHGRPTRFHDETVEEAYLSRAGYEAPDWQVEAWVSTYLALRDGSLSGVSDDVTMLTGRPARSLGQLLDEG